MLTPKELSIMELLWKQSPLSCTDIQKTLNWKETAIYDTFKTLQSKNMIEIADTRRGTRKPTQLYAPTSTNIEYMETLLAPIYNSDMLPSLFQQLIGKVTKQEALDELNEIVEKARSNLK